MDFTFLSVSKEEWNAFFNIRINKCRKLSPLTNLVTGHLSCPQRRGSFLHWCLTRAGTPQRAGGLPGGCLPGWGHTGLEPGSPMLLRFCSVSFSPCSHASRLFPRGGGKHLQRSPRNFQAPCFHIFLRWCHKPVETMSLLQLLYRRKTLTS